jgi:dihydroorotase
MIINESFNIDYSNLSHLNNDFNRLVLIHGDIFLGKPAKILKNSFLSILNGKIESFGSMENFEKFFPQINSSVDENSSQTKILNCENLLISPGLIDVHVHFRDPGFKFKEDIQSGSESAMTGGFTTVVCMANTSPTLDNTMTIDYLKNQIACNSKINIKFYCAATKNSLGNEIVPVQSLIRAGAIGFTDDGLPIRNSKILKDLLQYSALYNIVIAQHAEDHDLSNGGCVHHGTFSQKYHLKTIDPASEYSIIARDIALLEDEKLKNARYHVLHVSCKESIQYIQKAKEKGLNVTAEITPHHFVATNDLLHDQWSLAKMNPPLRSAKDVQEMIKAMQSGIIDIIASDHAPHEKDSKEKSISCASFGIIGLETMLPLSLELYFQGHLSLERILEMLTINPAKLLNETQRGFIEIGAIADLCIIDLNKEWIIDSFQMKSKSTNSPFNGRKVRGKNLYTIINGVLYSV